MTDQKEEFQEKYLQLQILGQEIEQIQKQLKMMNQNLLILASLEEGLSDFEKVKKGSEILIPLGQGIFAKADLKDNKNLFMNVGNGVVVVKEVKEVKETVISQISEIKHAISAVENEFHEAMHMHNELVDEINSLATQAMK